jgi:predicted metal-dependent peptidase
MEGGAGEQDGDKEGKGSGAKPEAGEGKQPAKDWTKIAAEAYTYAKLIGKEPGGMGRAFEHLRKHKINWRALLRRTVANKIPYDLTYSRPNKKYMAHDIFLPTTIGESVKVIASFDTSGSMSEKELSESLSEVIGIARSFSQVDVHVLSHDVDVHDDVKISDATVDKIKKIQVHGGGGTSHIPLYEYIRKKRMRRETKLLISFTDGYSEFPERKPDVDTIFVLTGMHVPPEQMPKWAVTVCLD